METLMIIFGVMCYLAVGAYVAEPVTEIGRLLFSCNGKFDQNRNQVYQLFVLIAWPYVLIYRFTHAF